MFEADPRRRNMTSPLSAEAGGTLGMLTAFSSGQLASAKLQILFMTLYFYMTNVI